MSTRGFVGVGSQDAWIAVYNHMDSYPRWLGPRVWNVAKKVLLSRNNLDPFVSAILLSWQWNSACQMMDRPLCPVCHTFLRSPKQQNHQHKVLVAKPNHFTSQNMNSDDWLFMEWGYIVDPATQDLHVFVGAISLPLPAWFHATKRFVRRDGSVEEQNVDRFWGGKHLATFSLKANEPNWEKLECEGEQLREQIEREVQKANAAHLWHEMLSWTITQSQKTVIRVGMTS